MLVPRHILDLQPYVAGKTIAEVAAEYRPARISKLASNENRLGCSEKALEAARATFPVMMNYPDPAALTLRRELARLYEVELGNVIAGSGSEGIMSLITRTFFLDHDKIFKSFLDLIV